MNLSFTKDIFTKKSRSSILLLNVLASFFIKGWSALVVLIMVPLTLNCLGIYKNGVWLTLSSLLIWIDQMDIGLGNGLRNKLTSHIAHNNTEEARNIISSTFAMLVIIMFPILIILCSLSIYCDIYTFFNVDESIIPEFRTALLVAITLVCMTFILKIIGNVYMGMQLPAVSNLILSLGQTVALIVSAILYYTNNATFMNIVIANTASPLLVYMMFYPYTFYIKFPQLRPTISSINLRSALELGNIGLKFFWLQIAALIQFMTANILISRFFTPEMVTPYQIAYRYMSIVMVFFSIVCMPFWNATTDAYERGDMEWIRNASTKMNWLSLAVAVLLIILTVISPFVYELWVEENKDAVSLNMTAMMALYIFLMILSYRYSYFLNGVGALRLQLYMTISSVVFIPLSWFVSYTTHSIICFMAVMCVCNLPGIIVNAIQFNKIINGKAKGIWRI